MATIFSDNFDSYSDGDLNGQGSWSGSTTMDVQGTTVQAGAKAIQSNNNGNGQIITHAFTATGGTPILSVYVRNNTANAQGAYSGISDSAGEGWYCVMKSDNTWYLTNPSAFSTTTAVGSGWSANTWYKVEIQVDTANKRARARIDGGTWSSYVINSSFGTQVSKIQLTIGANFSGTSYWDTLVVSSGIDYTTTLTETATAAGTLLKTGRKVLGEALTAADSFPRTITRVLQEAASTADTALRTAARTLADSAAVSDAIAKLRTASATLTEALTAAAVLIRTAVRLFAEALIGTDAFAGLKATSKTLTEALVPADALIPAPGRTLAEGLTAADTALRSALRTLTEGLIGSDAFAGVKGAAKTLSDALAATDSLIRAPARALAEGLAVADTALRTAARTLAEAITASTSVMRVAGRALTESAIVAATILESTGRTLSEGLSATAIFLRGISRPLLETITSSDSFATVRMFVRAFAEALTAQDTFRGRFLTKVRKGITLLATRADRTVLQSREQDKLIL
jgi:hypothetical protein